ncbi:MAG: hypothetical protein ABI778_02950, partial [Ignavibacteriota bacterium]
STPNKLPHSFLDYGDDNGDGLITGNEGLFNGVKYYYFLLATDEFDSVNTVGPLTTAIVNQKNFAIGIPCRPIFPDIPNTIAGDSSCISGAIGSNSSLPSKGTSVSLQVLDTGKFVQLYSNDVIRVSFQPRWTEYIHRVLNQSILNMNVDVTDDRQGKLLTYDKLYNPSASPVKTPYSFQTGIVQRVIGQNQDSNGISGRFTTNNTTFAPNETIDQAFAVLVDYQFQQLKDPYRLHSITFNPNNQGSSSIVGISGRTSRAPVNATVDYANIDTAYTLPSFQGGLGESSYEVSFGPLVDWREDQFDTLTGKVIFGEDQIKDPNSSTVFTGIKAMEVIVKATSHCDQQLRVIRPGNRNDVAVEGDYDYYNNKVFQTPNTFPDYTKPDTMVVPLAGKFAVDAFHYKEDQNDPSTAQPMVETTGKYYFPYGTHSGTDYLATIHRLRLGGAELTLNYPGISRTGNNTGDTADYGNRGPVNDFQPGDKFNVSFTGLMKGLPFPEAQFVINTSKDKKFDFSDNSLYQQSKILDQVQVVPNPYVVEHLGQTSTDNAKLYFTRLPPRATIEIYNLNGELIKTLEHNGTSVVNGDLVLADRYNVEEWNLLSEGRQRVGSQVFIARVIAKDAKDGTTVLGEMTTKFAVILGGYRLVR